MGSARNAPRAARGDAVGDSGGLGGPAFDSHPPGLVILDHAGEIVSATIEATEMLRPFPGADPGLPEPVYEVASRALASATLGHGARAYACVQDPDGRWLALHGSHLGESNQVAIVIEPARRRDLAAMIVEVHGLTPREREVAALWVRGLEAAETARVLAISPHTVHDHTKAIYSKLGVGSRAELTEKLLSGDVPPSVVATPR